MSLVLYDIDHGTGTVWVANCDTGRVLGVSRKPMCQYHITPAPWVSGLDIPTLEELEAVTEHAKPYLPVRGKLCK